MIHVSAGSESLFRGDRVILIRGRFIAHFVLQLAIVIYVHRFQYGIYFDIFESSAVVIGTARKDSPQ